MSYHKRGLILLSLTTILVVCFTINAQAARIDRLDERIQEIVQARNDGFVGATMSAITDSGIALTMARSLPNSEARNDSYKAVTVGGISVITLKYGIGKSRPRTGKIEYKPLLLTNNSDYRSFPSGHTTTAFALAATTANHYPDYKWYSYGLATLVGISRIYVNAHWASDVVAGAGLGYASAKFVEYKW